MAESKEKRRELKDLMKLADAREHIEDLDISHEDVDVDALRLRVKEDGILWTGLGDEEYQAPLVMTDWGALGKFRKHSGLDMANLREYLDDQDLVSQMVRHSLGKRAGSQARMVLQGDKVIEVVGTDEPWVAPLELFDMVVDTVGSPRAVTRLTAGARGVDFDIVTDINDSPPRDKNDISYCGLSVHWNGETVVDPFVFRMVCSNGMMSKEKVACTGESRKELEQSVLSNIDHRARLAEQMLKAFVKLADVKLKDPTQATMAIARNNRFSDHTTYELAERVPTMPDSTAYDMVNLFTTYAHKQPGMREKLWRAAGGAVETYAVSNCCNACGHVLN